METLSADWETFRARAAWSIVGLLVMPTKYFS